MIAHLAAELAIMDSRTVWCATQGRNFVYLIASPKPLSPMLRTTLNLVGREMAKELR